ncbi:MAG: hypothetical protein LCH54_09470 [Bacteroidetes bacterium]|nr:hypothetical protein [Bacteroidota bacterium]
MKLKSLLIVFLIFITNSVFGQGRDLVRLIYADSFTGSMLNGEAIREFIGSVHVERDGINLYCDRMIEFVNRRVIEATGHVKIVQNADILTSDFARYFPDSKFIYVERNVKLNSEGNLLTSDFGNFNFGTNLAGFWSRVKLFDSQNNEIRADSLDYNRNLGHSKMFRNIRIFSPKDNTIITGRYAENFNIQQTAFVERDAFLYQLPAKAGDDTLMIQSHRLDSDRRDSVNQYMATGKVRMIQGEMSAIADTMLFFKNTGVIKLREKPIVWYEVNQVVGDSIDIITENNQFRQMNCFSNAFSVSVKDESAKKYNQLRGKIIRYFFQDRQINQVSVEQTAESLYYLDQDGKPSGANFITGDNILINFLNNEVDNIRVLSGVEGKFYPERMMVAEPILLKNFKWVGKERPTPAELRVYVR